MRKLKIIHVIYGLKRAGAERALVTCAAGARERGHDVKVVTLTMEGALAEELRSAGIPVECVGKRHRYDCRVLGRLRRLFLREKPDVVHTHLFGGDLWGRTAAALARVPCIISHLQAVDAWLAPAQLFMERFTARFMDRAIAVSGAVRDFYVANAGFPGSKITVIPNAVACAGLPVQIEAERKRAVLGLRADTLLVGTAGRLEEQKDPFTWLQAARLIHERRPETEFIIAGEGSLYGELVDACKRDGSDRYVHFLGERDDVHELFTLCDIILFTSRFEGLSLALLEAMACAKPVVATRMRENEAVIEEGLNGMFAPSGDAAAFAAAVVRLCDKAGLRARLGTAAQQTVRKRFHAAAMVDAVCTLYGEMTTR